MFPGKPTVKDHFKAIFVACVVYTERVKEAFELMGLVSAPLPQVKSLPTVTLLPGQTSRMKNRG